MGAIRSGTGLISGINTQQLIDALITLQRAQVKRLEDRVVGFQTTQAGIKTLDANVFSILTSVQKLASTTTFSSFKVTNSDETQVKVTASEQAKAGNYQVQTLRTASTFAALSRGLVNADQQAIGAGTLTISTGGLLHRTTLIDALHAGEGIRRGAIRITDRSGQSADIDLSSAYTVDDVLDAINQNTAIAVTARAEGGRLVLADTSGSTSQNLSVADLNGGHAAEDLGIKGSVASSTLAGAPVFEVTGDFLLDEIDDGNRIRHLQGAEDVRITLSDDTVLEINLDGTVTVNDVLQKVNDHVDNGGKLLAELVDGRLVLTDQSGGGGSSVFAVEDINDATAIRHLGLDVAAAGNQISGRQLAAGINSVLLRNVRGGLGIDNIGQISLSDRAGTTAVVDLNGAESLDEVLAAINSATSAGNVKLKLTARLNATGTGIEVLDTSGSTAGNLVIADVGGGTLAAQLGIAVNAAQNSISSGRLNHRYIDEATSTNDYAPDGGAIEPGSFRIIDSAGNEAIIEISSAVKNIGDVLQRINAASGISVHAELNATGDGFVLVDDAAGSGTLTVEELGDHTASDLRILGNGVLGGDGLQRIDSRFAAVVTLDADDTLNDLVGKIQSQAGFLNADVIDDGSAFNPTRLLLTSTQAGAAGRLIIEDGLGLGMTTTATGQEALLRVGGNASTGFLIASDTNRFDNAIEGTTVEALQAGNQPASITISRDSEKIETALKGFIDSINNFFKSAGELTTFDPETNERGVLQGRGVVLRIESRLSALITRQVAGPGEAVRSLLDVGIRVNDDGTLRIDENKLSELLAENPEAVSGFFAKEDTGFAAVAEDIISSFSDPFTGALTLENNALQESVDSLNVRITTLDTILEARRERLVQQFAALETLLSGLQSQQQAIGRISRVTATG